MFCSAADVLRRASRWLVASASVLLAATSVQAAAVNYEFSASDSGGTQFEFKMSLPDFIPPAPSNGSASLLPLVSSCTAGGVACTDLTVFYDRDTDFFDEMYSLSIGNSTASQFWMFFDHLGTHVFSQEGKFGVVGGCDDCGGSLTVSLERTAVPEPHTLALLGLAFGPLALAARRRRSATAQR